MSISKTINGGQNPSDMLRRALIPLIKLYTDKSHFIYELLQNAEDSKATRIRFEQYEDRLEVFHNGIPFSMSNLSALCDISNSDKRNDINKIGEFGVGFKSVFCICEVVNLYSEPGNYKEKLDKDLYPKFSERVENFVHLEDIDDVAMPPEFTTHFVFPYHVGADFSGYKTIRDLKQNVAKRLQNLGANTLLFLKHLNRIEYSIDLTSLKKTGNYALTKHENRKDGYTFVESSDVTKQSYYVFSQFVSNKLSAQYSRTLDIAFAVIKDEKGQQKFVKADNPFISVYFSTETASELDFIIQGPFRTAPNRSSVPFDDEDNIKLAKQAAILFSRSIMTLARKGLMTLELLNLLPVHEERFNTFNLFKPIYLRTMEMLNRESILPRKNGGYTDAQHARIVRSKELAQLLSDDDLSELYMASEPIYWLPTDLTETSNLYQDLHSVLTKTLNIPVIRPEHLADSFNKNAFFLAKKSNDWLIQMYRMYATIKGIFATNESGNKMLTAPFVKVAGTGRFEAPYRIGQDRKYKEDIFTPTADGSVPSNIKIVDPEIYETCREFFDNVLALKEPSEYDFIIKPLITRYNSIGASYTLEQNIQDVKTLLKYIDNPKYNGELKSILEDSFRFIGLDENNEHMLYRRNDIKFPVSKEGFDLKLLYSGIGNLPFSFIDVDLYESEGISTQQLKKLGVSDSITDGESCFSGNLENGRRWETQDRQFWFCFNIPKLPSILASIVNNRQSPESAYKSSVLLKIAVNNYDHFVGKIKVFVNKNGSVREAESSFLQELKDPGIKSNWNKEGRWLYLEDGSWASPSNTTVEKLNQSVYGSLDPNFKIFEYLGFQKTNAQIQARNNAIYDALGKTIVSMIFEKYLSDTYNVSIKQFESQFHPKTAQGFEGNETYEFPSVPVKNSENLRNHVVQIMLSAEDVKYEERLRSVRTSLKAGQNRAYLESNYGYGFGTKKACQLCHQPQNSIESAELMPSMSKELSPLFLCLCPSCRTKYSNFRNNKTILDRIINNICSISDSVIANSKNPIEVPIDSSNSLKFTQTHLAEIREILNLLNYKP